MPDELPVWSLISPEVVGISPIVCAGSVLAQLDSSLYPISSVSVRHPHLIIDKIARAVDQHAPSSKLSPRTIRTERGTELGDPVAVRGQAADARIRDRRAQNARP